MLFFELNFLLLFLAPLLILLALCCLVGQKRFLPWIGSLASLIFLYEFSDISVAIAIFSIVLNYFGAKYLLKNRSKAVFATIVGVNLAVLGYFKYSILIDRTFFGNTLPLTWRIALPLGISFYTFQQIAFVSDVYRGKVTSFRLRTYMLFKLFFPQFIAGPITHFERVRASYERWPTFNARSYRYGLSIIAIGFVKKLAGDYFGGFANQSFGQPHVDFFTAWIGMLSFTFQIYFDFAGYSDMAVGIARLFGVSLPFNFNSPYKAASISDFWRRWHMTLSLWLRDYLYIPLGGNRHGALRTALALFTTMALGGLWHGAGLNFILWGVAHGVALIFVRFFGFKVSRPVGTAITFVFVMLTWVLFRANTFHDAMAHYVALLHPSTASIGLELKRLAALFLPWIEPTGDNHPGQVALLFSFIAAGLLCLLAPNSQTIALWFAARRVKSVALVELPMLVALILVLSVAFISPDTSSAFIYFQF